MLGELAADEGFDGDARKVGGAGDIDCSRCFEADIGLAAEGGRADDGRDDDGRADGGLEGDCVLTVFMPISNVFICVKFADESC